MSELRWAAEAALERLLDILDGAETETGEVALVRESVNLLHDGLSGKAREFWHPNNICPICACDHGKPHITGKRV